MAIGLGAQGGLVCLFYSPDIISEDADNSQ
jgi:hypothetical protein